MASTAGFRQPIIFGVAKLLLSESPGIILPRLVNLIVTDELATNGVSPSLGPKKISVFARRRSEGRLKQRSGHHLKEKAHSLCEWWQLSTLCAHICFGGLCYDAY